MGFSVGNLSDFSGGNLKVVWVGGAEAGTLWKDEADWGG